MRTSDDIKTIKTGIKTLSGNTNEVGSKEDVVFALNNNILKANKVAVAA